MLYRKLIFVFISFDVKMVRVLKRKADEPGKDERPTDKQQRPPGRTRRMIIKDVTNVACRRVVHFMT